MPSPHIPLLRRPLPPKKLPPLEPRPTPFLSGSASQQESDGHEKRGSRCLTPGASWEGAVSPPPARPQPTPDLPADLPTCQPEMFPSFPCRPPRTLPTMPLLHLLLEQPRYAPPPPLFLLNDFLLQLGHSQSHHSLRRRRVSVYHYKKLLEHFLFDLHSSKQTEVANQILSSEQIPPTKCRVPQRQMLCELEALIHMEYQVQSLRSVCDTVSQPKHTSEEEWPLQDSQDNSVTRYLGSEVILNSVTTKHFQGARRTHSPFEPTGGWGGVSPSQLAILDCLNHGGTDLNLKAHFISQLPDLSLLADTLVYLNLSFNNLCEFPLELCSLSSLQKLKLRDNPLLLLPAEIQRLTSLNTLVLSFCRLDHLPSELYCLPCLQYLDVSYNLLTSLSSDIRNLRSLLYLNVEGNQLIGLPAGVLRLPLSRLLLDRNYTHPLLWKTHTLLTPQRLEHTAAHTHTLTHTHLHHARLPPPAQQVLSSVCVCECCHGPMFGEGLVLIRPCSELFGVAMVPLVFYACSPSCYRTFRNQTENLTELLYQD